jgi:hypothetical protein
MNNEREQERISAEFPRHLRDGLARAAKQHDRSFSAELREATRAYLAGQVPGSASSRPEPAQRDETSHLGRGSRARRSFAGSGEGK